ncbi:esterase-like activity of phytase family protein [Sphingobium nicotianae]|uniref:Esterase-like activity of phytase family protein n=1 Tax=Sphingobium nicotianae TaxID=2782607 RepID=A0A9X1IRU0_9SPHN|nr:esterase-like activity of phytase family protein [Sphingobium nicotianae]MBT2187768.1 esterase-like activity of phytase family protein [Sphingobium nicotianae]
MNMFSKIALCVAIATPMPASSAAMLLATGTLSGATDASGLNYTLENGLAANFLGGVGSGFAYAGGNTFLSVPDRGPNATPYNSLVDDTVSYIARFHTMTMALTPSAPGSTLPYQLTPTLNSTTLLWSDQPLTYGDGTAYGLPAGDWVNTPGKYYFTGRSDNFGSGLSTNPAFARFDPESIRVSADGKTVFVSDEYGPFVRQFDRETGKLVKTFALPDNLAIANLAPKVDDEIGGNTSGRTTNKGMEGLAITPNGKTLVGIMQAATLQDAANPATNKMVRIVTIDIASGETKEYAYMLTNGSGVSDIVAINDHEFLVDERDGKGLGDGSNAKWKQVFKIDLAGATPLTNETGAAAAALAVAKDASPFINLVDALVAYGIPKSQIPSKIEGLSFGQDVEVNGVMMHTLYITDDNDFLPATSGPNHFYVFGFTDNDLPRYVPQTLPGVPEPASWAMMIGGLAFVGAALRGRKGGIAVRFV